VDWDAFGRECSILGLSLRYSQLDHFAVFEDALYKHNQSKNLTRVPREECWIRHFLDSLLFVDLFPPGASVLDIGTGPGFPAWPLACARPDLQVTAMDSNGKMLEFLRSQPLPNLTMTEARAEEADLAEAFDVVTGRAVAPLSIQLEISARPCKIGGLLLPLRTSGDAEAAHTLPAAGLGLKLADLVQRPLPHIDAVRLCPVFQKTEPTPKRYPRPWPEIKRIPLGS